MVVQDKRKQKLCSFYVSEFHLEMILLPYINKKVENNEKIIIQSEKDLTESINLLVSRINIKDENKSKILNLGWNKNNIIEVEDKSNIIIIGTEDYIKDKNEEIKNMPINRINVLDCYNFEEIKETLDNIIEQYDNSLNTLGNNNF